MMKATNSGHRIGDVVDRAGNARRDPSAVPFQIWHLVQISDGLDIVGLDFLRRLQIELYRPLMRSMKPVPRKKLSRAQRNAVLKPMREKIEPIFPGYAFIDYSGAGERWREIFKMAHIRGLVCNNGMPVEVPWKMIARIQGLEIDGAVPAETKLFEMPFAVGERVRITAGQFADFDGTIDLLPTLTEAERTNVTLEDLDDSVRVRLLVDLFGRSTKVNLSLVDIEKI
jgi:transcription antitermination factor NusG